MWPARARRTRWRPGASGTVAGGGAGGFAVDGDGGAGGRGGDGDGDGGGVGGAGGGAERGGGEVGGGGGEGGDAAVLAEAALGAALGAGGVEEEAGEGDVVDGGSASDDLLEVDHHEEQAVEGGGPGGGADDVGGTGVVIVEEAGDQAARGGVVKGVEHGGVAAVGEPRRDGVDDVRRLARLAADDEGDALGGVTNARPDRRHGQNRGVDGGRWWWLVDVFVGAEVRRGAGRSWVAFEVDVDAGGYACVDDQVG
jgi:hypothetical protein